MFIYYIIKYYKNIIMFFNAFKSIKYYTLKFNNFTKHWVIIFFLFNIILEKLNKQVKLDYSTINIYYSETSDQSSISLTIFAHFIFIDVLTFYNSIISNV